MQCTKHGIAAGPDGRCVICRRDATPDAASGERRLLSLGIISLALVTVSLVLARPWRDRFSPAVAVASRAPSIVAEFPPQELPRTSEPAADPLPVADQPAVRAAARSFDAPAEAELAASATATALAPAPAVSASAAVPNPSPSASQARPSDAALASAIRATPIVMFSTSWCAVCTRARAFLSANGLRYSERDIDRDQSAHDELKRRTGRSAIPTIEVDGQLLTPGFSERAIMGAVASSAQRRLGVERIEVRRQ